MQIKKLRLSGFKSFVEPAELLIRPGLTGVVGPNGCGKSNLLEAIRWVMGESSPKSMRSGGMDDVIFSGTERRPPRSFAEVSLTAERETDDGNALGLADNDHEIEVVRRIERGAGSAYRANGQDVRAKDVSLVFADAATGAHSPALVSQGKIAHIIAAKPVERRQMLEEAAGISGLHVRRKDAEQKLRAAETNLARLDTILADMEARANALRRQAKQAERYKQLSGEIRTAEGRLIYAKWRDAAAAADAAKGEASIAAERAEAATREQQLALAAQTEAAKQLGLIRDELQQARDALGEVRMRIAALTQERDGLQTRLSDLKAQQNQLEADRAREDSQGKEALAARDTLESEIAELEREQKRLNAERTPLAERIEVAERAIADAELTLAKAAAEEARTAAEIRVADAALAAAEQRHARLAAETEKLAAARAELADLTELEKALSTAQAARDDAQDDMTALDERIAMLEQDRTVALGKRDTAQEELAAAKADLSNVEAEHRALARELSGKADSRQALDAVRAETGYEHALAAALGEDLQASVGALDMDGSRAWTGADPAPGAAPDGTTCLLDHVDAPVELHARLAQIFVAERDDGQLLSPGQRLVTREGLLRRWDGFVSRGAGSSNAERLVRTNRLRALDDTLPGLRDTVTEREARLTERESAIGTATDAIRDTRQQRQAADERLRNALRAVDAAQDASDRHGRLSADLDEREAALSQESGAAQSELDEARERRAAQPDGAEQKAELARHEERRDLLRRDLQGLQRELGELDGSLTASREARAVATARIKAMQERSSEAVERLKAMAARAADVDAEIAKIADRPRALDADLADAQAEQDRLAEALHERETALGAAEAEAAEHNAALSDIAERLSLAREERAGAQARAEAQDLRRVEMGRISGEKFECPPQLLGDKLGFEDADVGQAQAESDEHDRLVAARERIGPVNLVAADELAELEMERESSAKESAELVEAINKLRGSIGSLNREGRQRLLAAFEQVDAHFRTLFTTLFDGGKAHLELIDSDDPLEAGLEIMAQPPGKKLQSLTLLSGGEQALTAVALIFALFLTNPAPICVLDEVDAPLDDANIERFCDLLDKMVTQTKTRYLIVTHNAVTMSRMHRLFGVTMIEKGVSQLVSVDLGTAEEMLAAE